METAQPILSSPLGALLLRLRKRADLTQEALAERSGVSVNTISNLEAGQSHLPRAATLALLAEALAAALAPDATEQAALEAAVREAARASRALRQSAAPPLGEVAPPAPPPAGTLTILVCLPLREPTGRTDRMGDAQALRPDLNRLLQQMVTRHGGLLVSSLEGSQGAVGVFPSATEAVAAACVLQQALWEPQRTGVPAQRAGRAPHHAGPAPRHASLPSKVETAENATESLPVCLALHTGWAEGGSGDYAGPTRQRAVRLARLGGTGQLLLTAPTREQVGGRLPDGVRLSEGGRYTVSVVERPQPVYQLLPAALPLFRLVPPRALPTPATTLPVQLTSFIGREREQAAVGTLLDEAPLLTLVGPGGSGKTRLALAVAAERLEDYPDGVWWVELAALDDGALVPQAVATTLGLREEAGQPLLAALSAHVGSRRALLVLDNCEHLLGACAELAAALLRRCPQLQVLATSRERLGVGGERSYRTPALATPTVEQATTPAALAALREAEGVRLFVERARANEAEFAVTAENAGVVVRICRQLDGLPLAIELAAARVGSLPLEAVAARLEQSLEMLTNGPRDLPPRQRALRATLDWSWALLGEAERVVLRRLAVFRGGWSVEAAEAVCGGTELGGQPTVGVLGDLVSKSLVGLQENEGQGRYGLLETVRQYAVERLEAAGEEASIRERHLERYLGLAEDAEPRLRGPEQGAWLGRLETEIDNLRAALRAAREQEDGERGLRLAGVLWRFWLTRGYVSEGRGWLEAALQLEGAQDVSAVRARALTAAGALAFEQGDLQQAAARLEEALGLRRALGETHGIAASLTHVGNVASEQGDYERAVALYEEALALHRVLGDPGDIASVLNNLGVVTTLQGDYQRATALYEEALALRRTLGDTQSLARSLNNRGHVASEQSDYGQAAILLDEALRLSRDIGARDLMADSLEGLAWVAVARGQLERAAQLGGAAEAQREALGVPLARAKQAGHGRMVQAIRAALGEEALPRTWAEGWALSLEEAVALALSDERAPAT